MSGYLLSLVGLAFAQVVFYEFSPKQAFKISGFLFIFYLILFSFVKGLQFFCGLYSISFYEVQLLAIVLFFAFGGKPLGFPHIGKASQALPPFYFFSGLWMSMNWLGMPEISGWPGGFLGPLLASLSLPILSGIKERLGLQDAPRACSGLPLLFLSTGFFLLGLTFLIRFSH